MNWEKFGIDIKKVRGGKTKCPKCSESRKHKNDPCLSVNIEEGLFNCHHCDFKGTVKEMKPKKEYVLPPARLEKVSPAMIKWFEGRGISNNTLLRFGITESKEYMPQLEIEMNCICFNYYRGEKLVNIKFRDGKKNFKLVKDAELVFYNLNALEARKEAVIVEGEIDCLTMHESGVMNAVSVPNGASKGNQRLEYLDNCIDSFNQIEKIVICTDSDEPGVALRDELIRRLGRERCFTVKYPEGCKDANEVLIKYGAEAVKNLVDMAEPLPIEGVSTIYDEIGDYEFIYEYGYKKGFRLGLGEIDNLITWRHGDFTIITGAPNSGKSTWLSNVVVKLAEIHDWRFAIFSPEKSPIASLMAEFSEIYIGKPFHRHDSEVKMSREELLTAADFISKHFWFMRMNDMDITIDGILDKAIELVKRNGINALLIDPWNYIEHKVPSGYSETQYISEALTKIKQFKDKYNVHVFLVAHPKKLQKLQSGQFEIPNLYDIAGSAHFFNKTDNGISVYRDYNNGSTKVYVQKIRFWYIGKVGNCTMWWDNQNNRYTEQIQNNVFEQ
jgi:twinkle protein